MEDYSAYWPWTVMTLNGLIAGWIAGLILGGGGLLRNMFVGIIGAYIGGAMVRANLLNLPFTTGSEFGDQVVVSTIGAIVIIILARIIAR
ncbi:MAG: GlsB/YeaQ/YmgE family stress response membrane protein [Hyphomicrobium sp.]|nr:GlsB/YeaQ/YmgE family stress response membrane protein [Hyphomicrobium sp.]